jgi:hypothetical protein
MKAVCLAIALPSTRAREKIDLSMMRTLIDNYAYDTKTVPQFLQDLVTAGYLGDLTNDPMTGSNRTRRFVYERAIDGAALGFLTAWLRSNSNPLPNYASLPNLAETKSRGRVSTSLLTP